ncbi:MAG: YfhO family protein [Candidatus Limivicinus sp.]|jgi:uncharacterized membrane protein YfhO
MGTKETVRIQPRKGGKDFLLYASAFIIPFAMFFGICAVLRRAPFGSDALLGGDLIGQYLSYFRYMQGIFRGENDFFYTFSKTLGGDMTGLWAYYLMSPFNIIFCLVPPAAIPTAVIFVIAAKIGLSGLTASVFFSKTGKKDFSVLIFSTAYALMSYNMVYSNNIMWLDAVYMLPVVVLGIERILQGRKIYTYTLSLGACLFMNYYTGYMVCIFSVLYFIYRLVVLLTDRQKGLGKTVLKYIVASLLSGALAAVVLIPTALTLPGTKASMDSGKLGMYPLYSPGELLSKFVCAAVPTGNVEGDDILVDLPALYCGAVSTVFLVLYFFNSRIKARTRLVTALFLGLLLLSFDINGTYVIWHAFNYPACFPYRNVFVFSFMILLPARQCFDSREGISLRSIIFAVLAVLAAVLIINPFSNHYVSKKMILLDLAVTAVCCALILLEGKRLKPEFCCAVLAVLQLGTLMINGVKLADFYGGSFDCRAYNQRLSAEQADIDSLKAFDDGFYRIGKQDTATNSPMIYSYDGLSHFSSTEQTRTKEFALNFGLLHFGNTWVDYKDSCPASADAFLGVKYVVTPNESDKGYEKLRETGRNNIYLNPNALDIAFPADSAVLTADLDEDSIFEWQNRVYSAAAGRDVQVFIHQEDVDCRVLNMSSKKRDDGATNYEAVNPDEEFGLTYSFRAVSDRPLYMYTTEPIVPGDVSATLYVNGKSMGMYMGSYDWRAVCLGSFRPGETVKVELKPTYTYFLQYNTYFSYEDRDALSDCCAEINSAAGSGSLEKLSGSRLLWRGNIDDGSSVLLFTVPNDQGWRASVDGERVEILTALDTLIAVAPGAGEHVVELRFNPPGLYAGAAVSLLSLILLIALRIRERKKSKN